MPRESLRIAVTGLAATYPFGGVFWDYLQYPLGFQRLGHTVLYIEDTRQWCYDPVSQTFVQDAERNAAYLAREIRALDPGLPWFLRDANGNTYGRSWNEVVQFCRDADLLVHVSASPLCWMPDEYLAAKKVAYIDTDPVYTQVAMQNMLVNGQAQHVAERLEVLRSRHVCFTFAENIGSSDCRIPTAGITWIPTRQPILLDRFKDAAVDPASRRPTLTTVASWKRQHDTPALDGVTYVGKSSEFERFLRLPSYSRLPLELALSGPCPIERLRSHGWHIINAYDVSSDPWVYRRYLANSSGEYSVAKNAYVSTRSGWFSCRTACYLALGVPAIVQDTGFTCTIPAGIGVLTFSTLEEAADAINKVAREPRRHATAAHDVAHAFFDSDKVLSRLIERALT